MSHYYCIKNGQVARYVQLTKGGQESQRVNKGRAAADGAVKGLTSFLKIVEDQGYLGPWMGKLGIQAGLACPDYESAFAMFKEERERASNRGSDFHDALEKALADEAIPEDPILNHAVESVRLFLKGQGIVPVAYESLVYFNAKVEPWGRVNFGGTVDGYCPMDVWDYKTVEPDDKGRYWTRKAGHCAQLAGYKQALVASGRVEPEARTRNLYIDRLTGNIVDDIVWSPAMERHGWHLVCIAAMAEYETEAIEKGAKK